MIQIKIQKTGKWIPFDKETSVCSTCGQRVLTKNIEHYKYCFNCNTKMITKKKVDNTALEDIKKHRCKDCYHWRQGRCWKTLGVDGKGIRTAWNHICRSDDFTTR